MQRRCGTIDAANRIAAKNRPFDRAHFGASVERVISSTKTEIFAAYRELGSLSELPVLILGMPRSGTTLVEQIVSSHPEVAGGDELTFWNHAAQEFGCLGEAGMTPSYLDSGRHRLRSGATWDFTDGARVTDKMPFNFRWIGLFLLVFPSGRIIHCRRNPIDTCLSNLLHQFPIAVAASSRTRDDLVFYYRQYLRLMAHWRAVVPAGRFI